MQTLSLGKHNPKLTELRNAIRRSELTAAGLLPIEGPKLLEEAVRSGLEVMDVFIRRGVGLNVSLSNSNVYEVEDAIFKTVQSTETSQGIIALVRPPAFSLGGILSVANPLIVVLARLQDPGNVGTILRVAESFGATGCIALPGTAGAHNSKTVRASAGSVFRLPHVWNVGLHDLVPALDAAGVKLAGTSPAARQPIDAWDWSQPGAVLVGNEGSGLSDEETAACDTVLRIPQNPAVESLNSAIATAVILYEASKHERTPVRK